MSRFARPSRRELLRGALQAGAAGWLASRRLAAADQDRTPVFAVTRCPVHDGQRRHIGVDALLSLLAGRGIRLYRTDREHAWGGPDGIVAADDIVVIKINCQWSCRGATNTDVLRGLVHRILEHPDGFAGEVAIVENGQGRGSFDGRVSAVSYGAWPEIVGAVHVNAEEETLTTVDYLVEEVFAGEPVSACRLDGHSGVFLAEQARGIDGYRRLAPPAGIPGTRLISYPCFTTARGHHIDLRAGRWTGSGFASNVKLINLPVLKHHEGCGVTGALKHCYGLVSMQDGSIGPRHYAQVGYQCGQFWAMVRPADLHLLDCIWVSHGSLEGYPPRTTTRCNTLLAALDPVALDYWAARHVLLPAGGWAAEEHDPDLSPVLRSDLAHAQQVLNAFGGIAGQPCRYGDASTNLVARSALPTPRRHLTRK